MRRNCWWTWSGWWIRMLGMCGVACTGGSARVEAIFRRCRFEQNSGNQGGAVFAGAGASAGSATVDVDFEHCVSADKLAKDGGAVAITRGGSEGSVRLWLNNSILWANSPRQIDGSDVWFGSWNNIVMGGLLGMQTLDEDPRFVNSQRDNYLLASDSPAIDAEDPTSVPQSLTVDPAGTPRVQGAAPDPGAFERK